MLLFRGNCKAHLTIFEYLPKFEVRRTTFRAFRKPKTELINQLCIYYEKKKKKPKDNCKSCFKEEYEAKTNRA